MIMDTLQEGRRGRAMRCYSAKARIREDPELIATLRFYLAPPGAKVFPGVHAFGSNAWENGDWDAPRSGLGFLDFDFTNWDAGVAPPGVTGQSTPTPLDWFLNGVPPDVVGPYPNGRCVPQGSDWIVQLYTRGPSAVPVATFPLAGVQVLQFSIRDCVSRWLVGLYSNNVVPDANTTLALLAPVSWQGYNPQSPLFSTTQEQADGSSVTISQPVTFITGTGSYPQNVYGYYIQDTFTGQLIAAARLPGAPLVLTAPGQLVALGRFWFVLSPTPIITPVLPAQIPLGIGGQASFLQVTPLKGQAGLGLGGKALFGGLNPPGFDFRSTAGFVTDPAGCVQSALQLYPTSLNGVNNGWVSSTQFLSALNVNSSLDPRIAGVVKLAPTITTQTRTFQVDLPAAGAYTVAASLGHPTTATPSPGLTFTIFDSDGVTVLQQWTRFTTAPNLVNDAAGNAMTAANWPSQNVPVTVTFSGTSAFFALTVTATKQGYIGHLRITQQ